MRLVCGGLSRGAPGEHSVMVLLMEKCREQPFCLNQRWEGEFEVRELHEMSLSCRPVAPSLGLGMETLRGFWWAWAVLLAVKHHFKEWRGAGCWEGREGVAGCREPSWLSPSWAQQPVTGWAIFGPRRYLPGTSPPSDSLKPLVLAVPFPQSCFISPGLPKPKPSDAS